MTASTPQSRTWLWYLLAFFLGVLGSFVLASALGRWFPGTEPCLRSTGGFLQVVGLLAVAWGMAEVRRSYGLRPASLEILDHIRSALRKGADRLLRALGLRPPPPIVMGVGAATFGGLGVRATGTVGPPANATVEQRVDFLMRQISRVEELLGRFHDDLEREAAQRTQAIAAERQERETALDSLRLQLRDFAVGGLRLQTIGLWWLFLSVVFATWSQEAAKLPIGGAHFGCVGTPAPPPTDSRWH
jgi:hypothetical protein